MKENSDSMHRLQFGTLVDRIFWALLVGTAVYSASQLRELSNSVIELKTQLAVGFAQIGFHEKRLDGQRDRMDRLEAECHRLNR